MTSLSIVEEREDGRPIARVIAAPLFPISPLVFDPGATVIFELFESDSSALARRVGEVCLYAIASDAKFWAKLISLEPCISTHEGLAHMRNRPTLRATFEVFGNLKQAGNA